MVAFEIAKKLETQGYEVKFVGVVNIPPNIANRMHEITYTAGLLNLSYFLGLISKERAETLEPKIEHLVPEQQISALWEHMSAERIQELQLTPRGVLAWVALAQSLINCGKHYQPQGSVCE